MSEEKNLEGAHKEHDKGDKNDKLPNDNKQLANETHSETGNQKPESIPQTANIKPETENMEVHKHPHHVTHKKKWGEYFLEFLMLFLAVFLGFLAENFREHQVEKERAKQYILSFCEDLKKDTTRINTLIKYDDEKIAALSG